MRKSLIATNIVCALIVVGVILMPKLGRAQVEYDSLTTEVARYHIKVNEEVNEHFQGLYEVLRQVQESETKAFNKDLRARFGNTSDVDCLSEDGVKNLSVSCLNQRIELAKSEILLPAINAAQGELVTTGLSGADLISLEEQRSSQTTELLEQANLASKQILDAYSQIVLTHILHTELQFTAERIENLNEVLGDFESELNWLPLKFVDISTSQCR